MAYKFDKWNRAARDAMKLLAAAPRWGSFPSCHRQLPPAPGIAGVGDGRAQTVRHPARCSKTEGTRRLPVATIYILHVR
jgi:hypothetical protein